MRNNNDHDVTCLTIVIVAALASAVILLSSDNVRNEVFSLLKSDKVQSEKVSNDEENNDSANQPIVTATPDHDQLVVFDTTTPVITSVSKPKTSFDTNNSTEPVCTEDTIPPPEETKKPEKIVKLYDLSVAESQSFMKNTDVIHDTVGNRYEKNAMFFYNEAYVANGYAWFYLGNRYKTLSGTIAARDSSFNKESAVFEIIGNDTVLYSIEEFTRIQEPKNFKVNVEGVDWLTIKISNDKVHPILADWSLSEPI